MTRLIVLLMLGAIVNVAVAWSAAAWLNPALAPERYLVREAGSMIARETFGGARVIVISGHGCRGRIDPVDPEHPSSFLPKWLLSQLSYPLASEEQIWSELSGQSGMCFFEARGWPMMALCGAVMLRTNSAHPERVTSMYEIDAARWKWHDGRRFLPMQPLWPGFAINTIFYAAVLWMVFAMPFVVRRRSRIKRGLCPACAYPVGASPVCTECGKPVTGRSDDTASP